MQYQLRNKLHEINRFIVKRSVQKHLHREELEIDALIESKLMEAEMVKHTTKLQVDQAKEPGSVENYKRTLSDMRDQRQNAKVALVSFPRRISELTRNLSPDSLSAFNKNYSQSRTCLVIKKRFEKKLTKMEATCNRKVQ